MKPADANFTPAPSFTGSQTPDGLAADLAAGRHIPALYKSALIKVLIYASFLLANFLSFAIVRQGLLTMQTFSHVSWLTGGVFETLLALLIQAGLAFFGLMFNDRIRGLSSGLTWMAALFALLFWTAEFYFGALTQSLGSVAPAAFKQMETRAARLQVEIGTLGADIASEFNRQIAFNRRESANEDRGVGLSRVAGCLERCKEFQGRAMALERRFGMLAEPLPGAAGGDLNAILIDAGARLKLLEERATLLPEFGALAGATDKLAAFRARLAQAVAEHKALSKSLDEHPAITPTTIAADYAAGLIRRLTHGEFTRIAAHEWVIVFYAAVFIMANWFMAVLLAIYNRNRSPTGIKARRAQELDKGTDWDARVAEGEARATAGEWMSKLRARFWHGMAAQ